VFDRKVMRIRRLPSAFMTVFSQQRNAAFGTLKRLLLLPLYRNGGHVVAPYLM
jgi:hypothetical protein